MLSLHDALPIFVDAARLVALGADDVQAAGFLDRVVALLPFGLQARAGGVVDGLAGLGFKVRQFGVQRAAEHDVGTAAGHVGGDGDRARAAGLRSEEHTSELQSLMRISYAVFCLKKKKNKTKKTYNKYSTSERRQ